MVRRFSVGVMVGSFGGVGEGVRLRDPLAVAIDGVSHAVEALGDPNELLGAGGTAANRGLAESPDPEGVGGEGLGVVLAAEHEILRGVG